MGERGRGGATLDGIANPEVQPYTLFIKPRNQKPRPYPLTPTPYSLHPTPYTLLLTPHTLHPTPHTSHPTPYTSHLTPYTSHLTPHTLHPTPYTLHPTPYTLHPTRYTLQPGTLERARASEARKIWRAASTARGVPSRRAAPSTTLYVTGPAPPVSIHKHILHM